MTKKGRPCLFCNAAAREELEAKIITGRITQTEAARQLGQSRQSVNDHMRKHVTMSVQGAMESLGFEPITLPVPEPVDVSLETGLNVYNTLSNISQVSMTIW
ncbi:MAG TPA: winged helix-turn-helix domain-containing protein [Candidatus Saccharimonadales bacterium]|jgi:hypothetical protein